MTPPPVACLERPTHLGRLDFATYVALPDFATYVAEQRPALLRAAWAISGDPHTAEDLVQTALVKVGARWEHIREPRAIDSYVRRAMVNLHRTWCRDPRRARERLTDEPPEGPAVPPPDGTPTGTAHELWPLVAALPPCQRSAVALRYYEGLTEAETAEALDCSLGTVKSNTSRGLATLRRWYHHPERSML